MNHSESSHQESSLGEILKNAREGQNKTLEGLSAETKISLEVLESLENDTFNELPAIPYIKAFLVTLGNKLNLKSGELISQLMSQMNLPSEEPPKVEKSEFPAIYSNSSKLIPVIIIFVIGALLLFALLKLQNISQNPIEELPPEPSIPTESLPGLTEMETIPEDSTINQDSINLPQDTVVEAPTEPKTKDVALPKEKPQAKLQSTGNNFLVLQCIKDSVWINVKRNGKKEVNKKMSRGLDWTLSITDTMIVTSGVKSAIEFNLNGKSHLPEKQKFSIINGKYQGN